MVLVSRTERRQSACWELRSARRCPTASTWVSDLAVLTKVRVNVLVVASTFVGFALHVDILPNSLLLLQTLLATGLVACGAAVANQVLEVEFDRLMNRTKNRPLAAGRMNPRAAAWLSATLCLSGSAWLGVQVNLGAMMLACLAFSIYAFTYTPLKRKTPWCTPVGAVAGALPFTIGWAATDTEFGPWAFVGFAVLFLWQIPHVLAIAWWRRSEYSRAGFYLLGQSDIHGKAAGAFALCATLALIGISLLPIWLDAVSFWYIPGSLALGIVFIISAGRFFWEKDALVGKALFVSSLYYLPGLYLLMLASQK